MKLVTYDAGDGTGRPGALLGEGDRVLDLARATDGAIPSSERARPRPRRPGTG